jgi:iron(III) transport system permease protein
VAAAAPALERAVFVPMARDRATAVVAAFALAVLAIAPWSGVSGPSALVRAFSGEGVFWPLIAASARNACALGVGQGRVDSVGRLAWRAVGFGVRVRCGHERRRVRRRRRAGAFALTVCFARAIARRGVFNGDPTVATIVVVIAALLLLFIFYPVGKSLLSAVLDVQGNFAPALAAERLLTADIWSLDCSGAACAAVSPSIRCCSPRSSVCCPPCSDSRLRSSCSAGGQRFSGLLKVMSILPIITPPFVIALALVVLFGRTGLITGWLSAGFGIPRTRWIYGLPGVTLAQLLSFSPIAFMILHGAWRP